MSSVGRARVCVLRTDGTNCDKETAHACELARGLPQLVHVNELRSRSRHFRDYQFLVIPGGFSYGDDVASGRILANELAAFFTDELTEFVRSGKPILGICNGFQVLVRAGLLPMRTLGAMKATLSVNACGHFECRWVDMVATAVSQCIFTRGLDLNVSLPVAHGEGRFDADKETLAWIEQQNLVVLRYAKDGRPTQDRPANPNGSLNAIAGICDPTGCILGLMPHPERFVEATQHPNYRRMEIVKLQGLMIFENAVRFAEEF